MRFSEPIRLTRTILYRYRILRVQLITTCYPTIVSYHKQHFKHLILVYGALDKRVDGRNIFLFYLIFLGYGKSSLKCQPRSFIHYLYALKMLHVKQLCLDNNFLKWIPLLNWWHCCSQRCDNVTVVRQLNLSRLCMHIYISLFNHISSVPQYPYIWLSFSAEIVLFIQW